MTHRIPSSNRFRKSIVLSFGITLICTLLGVSLSVIAGKNERQPQVPDKAGIARGSRSYGLAHLFARSMTSTNSRAMSALSLQQSFTINVNSFAQSPGGSGDCTLGEAIEAANTDSAVDGCTAGVAGFDTIVLPAGTYTLSTVDNTTIGATGLTGITSGVVIQGAGAATTIIERDPNATLNFRLLAIVDQVDGSLILNDVTLKGGTSDGNGGALHTLDRPTTLNNVDLTGNTASFGGAVAGVFLTVNNSTFTSNRATASRGGDSMGRFLLLDGSTFTGNKAGTGGGAIFFNQSAGANFTITDSTFVNNSATTNHGGAIESAGIASITGCTFDGNTADGEGGAIYAGRSLYIFDSVIINNHANDIGGIAVQPGGEGHNSWMSVNRCNISHNTSNGRAGGILFAGGVQNFSASISNSTISGNTAGFEGGGLFNAGGAVTLSNVTIDGNTGSLGGGIFYGDESDTRPLNLNNVTITGNRATNHGGGLFRNLGIVNFKNSIIALNTSDSGFAPDIRGALGLNSLGYNFIGIKDGGAIYTDGIGDQTGSEATPLNPQLGALQNNGGPTFTRALLGGSTAIDAGNPAVPGSGGDSCEAADQRAILRPNGDANSNARCDIGAYETQTGGGCLPLAVPPSPPPSTNEDTAVVITLKGEYSQPSPNLTFAITQSPSNGSLGSVSAANCTFSLIMTCTATVTYTPALNYNGPDDLKFKVSAGGNDSDIADVVITVNPVNDPPVAIAQSVGTAEDAPLPITLTASDIDSSTLTFSIVTPPAHGSFGATTPPNLTYTPDANYNGPDSFTFKANDGSADSNTAPISIVVSEVNDAPDAVNDPLGSGAEDSGMRTIPIATLLSNDLKGVGGPANENGQTLTFSLVAGSEVGGTISSDATNVYFTPTADFNGAASFQYTVTDNGTTNGAPDPKSDTATVSFTVTEVNDAPSAVGETLANVGEDSGQHTIPFATLTANDSKGPANESGQTLIVKTVSNPINGSVGILGGNVVFTPSADYFGPASFDYTVEDNGTTNGVTAPLTSGTVTASFTVTEVNDAPTAVNDPLGNIAEDSGPRLIPFATLTANDSKGPANESGQSLIVNTVSNAVGGTVSIVGNTVHFTPTADYFGQASFQYTVEDNGTTNGVTDPKAGGPAVASFHITEVNDAPAAVNDTLTDVTEDSGQRTIPFATLTGNDSKGPANESGQTLIVKTVTNPVGGTVSIAGGNVQFTPTANFNGPASFDYTVEDNGTTNGVANPLTSGTATASFNITAVADTPSVTNATTNANTQTTSGLVISRNPADGAEVTHFKIAGITGGTLFKNNGTTVINNGDFITFAEGNAGLKFTPGSTNGSFTVQSSSSASDAGLGGGTATATITINPLGGVIKFSAANYSVAEGAGFRVITVERTGDTSQAATVDYASSDQSMTADALPCTAPGGGLASWRCDFTTAIGTLRFAAGETSKTFNVLISQDNYVEGTETLDLTLSNPTGGAVLGAPATAVLSITDDGPEPATNPIDNSSDFVRSLYHDFLNREPDPPGLAFWIDNIDKCNDPARRPAGQTVAQCIDKQRESTAIAFFMSPESQMTGGFVYRLYKGSLTGSPNFDGGSAGRFPTLVEFVHDVSQVSEGIVVGNQIDGAVVEANRNRLAWEFVQRPEFLAKYGGLNDTLYVQELFNTTGIAATAGEKQALVDGLGNGTETRASVLRKVVDGTVVISESNVQFTTTYGQAFYNQEYRRVFVYMEYVGFLRRNPDAPGFNFWLGKLNFFNGDPFQAEMVRSFILSPEYRSRFGQP